MQKTVLVTGSAGLVGSECVRHFAARGWACVGTDSNSRKEWFGRDGDTRPNLKALSKEVPGYRHHGLDVRDRAGMAKIVQRTRPALVVHAAAQPSHDLAASRPFDDFDTNATGTLNLLEACRRHAPEAAFAFLSTNKVYGDNPNRIECAERKTRWEPKGEEWAGGIGESMSVDACTHSIFGCGKLAADAMVQEYGRYFGMPTAAFRCGCLTGGAHAGAAAHGFLAYLARCLREGRAYQVIGYRGKQVRDNLHAADVALAVEAFAAAPTKGEAYNLGGGKENALSVLEAIFAMEEATGKKLQRSSVAEPRKGDHRWYVSDTSKFRRDYPAWTATRPIESIIGELCKAS